MKNFVNDPDYYFPAPEAPKTPAFARVERTEVRYNPDGATLLREFCRGFLRVLLPFMSRHQ